jgi:hypothetical protein
MRIAAVDNGDGRRAEFAHFRHHGFRGVGRCRIGKAEGCLLKPMMLGLDRDAIPLATEPPTETLTLCRHCSILPNGFIPRLARF